VIPLFNGQAYIEECLKSVFAQTYKPVEIIVVDDGSTDRSLEIVQKLKPENMKIICQNHGDVSKARNTGIKNAGGELIAFIDHDDIWLPEKLEKQAAIFAKNTQVDLVFSDIMKFFPSGKRHRAKDKHDIALSFTDENLFNKLVVKNVLMPSAVMIKKESIITAGLFDPSFRTCGDYEMWLRMALLKYRFHYLPEALTLYRMHAENASSRIEVMYHDRIKAVEACFSHPNISDEDKQFEKRGLAAAYLMGAHTFFSVKDYGRFLDNAKKALSYNKKIINLKFISRYLRSWFYVKIK
jgi:glycosyltransferase involved in cell wall biosynthesis